MYKGLLRLSVTGCTFVHCPLCNLQQLGDLGVEGSDGRKAGRETVCIVITRRSGTTSYSLHKAQSTLFGACVRGRVLCYKN